MEYFSTAQQWATQLSDKLSPIFGTAQGAFTILTAAVTILGILITWWRGRTIKSGLYTATWSDHDRLRLRTELVHVKRSLRGVRIRPLQRPKAKGDYSIRINYTQIGTRVLKGGWERPNYSGCVQVTHHQNNDVLLGRWLGPDREANIRSGDWYSKRVVRYGLTERAIIEGHTLIDWLAFPFEILLSQQSHVETLSEQKLNLAIKDQIFPVKGLELRVPIGVFNPTFGSITHQVLDCAAAVCTRETRVLDLGTGSGFYAIYLAKNIGCKVVGIDSDPSCVILANENARRNGVEHLCSFHVCEPNQLFSWAHFNTEFDLIVANLPFSSIKATWRSRRSPYFKSFRGSRRLLTQLILQSLSFLHHEGVVIFATGSNGYPKWLKELLRIAPWSCEQCASFTGQYDTSTVLKLSLDGHLRGIEAQIVQIAGVESSLFLMDWDRKLPKTNMSGAAE